jgi:hypothetical protein
MGTCVLKQDWNHFWLANVGFKSDGVIETHIQIRTRCNEVDTY